MAGACSQAEGGIVAKWAEGAALNQDQRDEVADELHLMKTAGIIEVAVRNPSVAEYMAHWEERAKKAEAEIAMLREVNAAQADNYTSLARQLADREEQLRKAHSIKLALDNCVEEYAEQLRKAQERIRAAEAERDRAWNEAIEAAATDLQAFQERAGGYEGAPFWLARAIERIRLLAKEAGE
jgi:chromosome segregation ATPase